MTVASRRGERDVARAASALAACLPAELAGLARLAYDYRWAWWPGGEDLFRFVDAGRWDRCGGNPVRLLQEASAEALARAAAAPELRARVDALERAIAEEPPAPASERPVAFFCAECAIHRSLPIYAGGLGALAGDLLKRPPTSACRCS